MFDSRADSGYVEGGFDARIPVWDGRPESWERFKKDIKWWQAGEDLTKIKFNVGVRFVKRQRGIVKSKLEDFDPVTLAGRAPVITVPADPIAGTPAEWDDGDVFEAINSLLMPALASMTGIDDKAEKNALRDIWHKQLYRKPGERMIDWCQRFREQRNAMKLKGVEPEDEDCGYWLKEKSNLSVERTELLDTALNGDESHDKVEREMIRLFKKMHERESRQQPPGSASQRSHLTLNHQNLKSWTNTFRSNRSQPSRSSQSTAAPSRSAPSTAASTYSRSRQAHVAEAEVIEDLEQQSEQVDENPETDESDYMQEAFEAMATELEEAEAAGVDGEALDQLEADAQILAEAMVTLRESRSKVASMRTDRKYAAPPKPHPAPRPAGGFQKSRAQPPKRGKCNDCLEEGHWAGDKVCKKPGANLSGKIKPRQVHVAEHEIEGDLEQGDNENYVAEAV